MKSISEIQNEIKEIGIRLGELVRELEDLKPQDKINTQTDFAKISRLAQQHPIKDHHLAQADNYKKKLYLSVLSAIAQTNNDEREGKLVFLQRIALGINYEGNIESLVKDGMDINDKILDEFVRCMTDNDSKHLFIFESLVISNLGGEIDDIAKKYISDLSGYLGIAKNEVFFLMQLSVCVLEQSMSKYQQLADSIPKIVNVFMFFNLYLKDFIRGVVCNTKWLYYAYGSDADADMISSIYAEETKVIFDKMRFDLEKIHQNIMMKKYGNVTFKNCDFKSKSNYIQFETVDNINFISCKFVGFERRVCVCNDECKFITIEKCIFERCGYLAHNYENDYYSGGCFYISKINSFVLRNSEFIDCYIKNSDSKQPNGAIAYLKEINVIEVENIIFTSCHCYSYYTRRVPYYLLFYGLPSKFQKNEYFINCKIIDSSDLY